MNLINKIKSYFSTDFDVVGEDFKPGFKTIKNDDRFVENHSTGVTTGDRKRYFTTYNQDLVDRISDINSSK
jgi:hypothetical protein